MFLLSFLTTYYDNTAHFELLIFLNLVVFYMLEHMEKDQCGETMLFCVFLISIIF